MNFKEKIERLKEAFGRFESLEKSVQAQLMAVADKMAPMVQGGGIAPKTLMIPEPVEYPDIKEEIVATAVKKHELEIFADQFEKSDWKPSLRKTQKDPSTQVPFVQKPESGGPIHPDNVSAHLQTLRDQNQATSPVPQASLHVKKANASFGALPAHAPIKSPAKNIAEPKAP